MQHIIMGINLEKNKKIFQVKSSIKCKHGKNAKIYRMN